MEYKIKLHAIGREKCYLTLRIYTETRERETIEHKKVQSYKKLSITGEIRTPNNRGIICLGQCYDTMLEIYPNDERLQKIVAIWKRWHLNDLKAGCIHQKHGDYSNPEISGQVCPETGYKYGTSYLLEELPEDVIQEAIELFR